MKRGAVNLQLAGSLVPETLCYFVCRDVGIEKLSFDAFLGKVEVKRRRAFRNLWAVFIYLWIQNYIINFVKEVPKIVTSSSAL